MSAAWQQKTLNAQPVVSLRKEVEWGQFQQHLTATYIQGKCFKLYFTSINHHSRLNQLSICSSWILEGEEPVGFRKDDHAHPWGINILFLIGLYALGRYLFTLLQLGIGSEARCWDLHSCFCAGCRSKSSTSGNQFFFNHNYSVIYLFCSW